MSEPVQGDIRLVAEGAPPLVLASGSTARAAMLRAVGLPFTIVRPLVDEASLREALAGEGVAATDAAVALAEMKARKGADLAPAEAIVLGADQLLELDGRWLEKPCDLAAARTQLQALAGRSHRLISAVVAYRGGVRVWHTVDEAKLRLRPLDETAIDTYLELCGDAILRCVGAYRIEGPGLLLMDEVAGDHFTIRGMPLLPVLRFLREQRWLLV